MSDITPKRPVMRYFGGKWMLAPWIISHFPEHRIYVEPYGGSASVLLRKPLSYSEVYNDLDNEIVNVFRVLRDPNYCKRLTELLTLTPFARTEFHLSYESSNDPAEQARRTIFRTFAGFGSNAQRADRATGFRSNSNRSGTTPAHDWANYPGQLGVLAHRLRGVVVECRNAIDVIRQHDTPGTLCYCDPPYLMVTRGKPHSGGGYRHEMSDDQHRELAAVLHSVRGMVVLSGYPSELYEELYAGWERVERRAYADGASARTECLWISPRASERLVGRLAL